MRLTRLPFAAINNNNNKTTARARTQVKLYWRDSLACHGYLIDESWLIAASQCFANNASSPLNRHELAADEWSAEISYEHYGNEDYKQGSGGGGGLPARRRIKAIHLADQTSPSWSPIVLAKLDRSVRFR